MANTTRRAMKRAASTLQGAPGLDITLPDLPYTHYAVIYIDHEGTLKTKESQSIQEQDISVFSENFRQNFIEILGKRIRRHQFIRQKRSHRFRQCKGFDNEDLNTSVDMTTLRVGDTERVTDYYEHTMNRFLQRNCSVILKAVIKFIEPQKQVKHPYNGGGAGDPEKTRPKWWPSSIKHKEPDHIRKEDRIELFLHILRKGVTADKLEEIAIDTKRDLKHPGDVKIIYELCRVRKMEERFERNEVDANMLVYDIINHTSSAKENQEKNSSKAVPALIGAPKAKEQGPQLVPVEQGSTLTRTIKDPTSASIYDVSGNPSIPVPLNFEVVNRQNNPNYNITPEYTNPFSQPKPSTPKITDTPISIHNNSLGCSFDYQPTEVPRYYGPSIDISSYQPVAPPQVYGSTAASQSTTMHSQIPMASTNFRDINYHNTISQGSQPYHLGSIRYPNRLPSYYGGSVYHHWDHGSPKDGMGWR